MNITITDGQIKALKDKLKLTINLSNNKQVNDRLVKNLKLEVNKVFNNELTVEQFNSLSYTSRFNWKTGTLNLKSLNYFTDLLFDKLKL